MLKAYDCLIVLRGSFQNKIRGLYEKIHNRKLRKKLKNKNFSLFSPNCYAGIIYHRLGLRFLSPTINLFFPSKKQYLKYVSNIRYYSGIELEEYKDDEYDCPVGIIDDVIIVFNHSKTFKEAHDNWEKRKQRINYDNLYIIFDDYVDAEYEDLIEFNKIQCKNKVILTAHEYNDLPNAIQIKKYSKDELMQPYLMDVNPWTGKNPADEVFNYVKWLNE